MTSSIDTGDPNEAVTNLTPAQLAKLTKPVQREIDRLISNVRYYKERANAGPETSDTHTGHPFLTEDRKYLPRGETITFVGRKPEHGSVMVQVTEYGIEVSTTTSEMVVRPRGSNSIYVAGIGY